MTNKISSKIVRPRRTTWNDFDSLPRAVKEIIWYSQGSYVIKGAKLADMEKLRGQAEFADRQATLATYGPDHPQSARVKARMPTQATSRSATDCGL